MSLTKEMPPQTGKLRAFMLSITIPGKKFEDPEVYLQAGKL